MQLSEYQDKFKSAVLTRDDGVLEVRLQTDGGTLQWSPITHNELPELFRSIGSDYENRVVILTGTGEGFTGPVSTGPSTSSHPTRMSLDRADEILWEGKQMIMNLLNIDAPVIAAINGPAMRHAELALLSDIVLMSENAVIQDSAHVPSHMVPGDGMHVVYQMLFGPNRGRAYLLTGKVITAQEAFELGVAFEVLPREQLLPRARELAASLAEKPKLMLRYTRVMLVEHIKRQMQDLLGYGLSMEMLALQDRPEA